MQASIVKTTVITMLADLFMLEAIMALALFLRSLFGGEIALELYLYIFAGLLLMLPLYALFDLYPPVLVYAVEAVRRLSQATTCLFLLIFAMTFFFKTGGDYSRLALCLAWLLSILIMPVWRGMVKRHFSRYSWWGNGLILCGSRKWLNKAVAHLCYNRSVGLKPCGVVFLEGDSPALAPAGQEPETAMPVGGPSETAGQFVVSLLGNAGRTVSLPVLSLENMPDYARSFNSPYALINLENMPDKDNTHLAELSSHFKKTFFAFPFLTYLNCWTNLTDMGGQFVLETRQKLLDVRRQYIKRTIDLFLTLCGAAVFIPITLIIAFLIKWEDGGPVFFAHTRIGKGGRKIKVFKFRTMVPDAEALLREKLAADPELAREWQANHKLKNDPRITKTGKWLRKSSLDELPQVWNVLKGELSFVGPRPIVEAEIEKYGPAGFELYKRVLPGLTGYWQISGRSSTTYEQRVSFDSYYIRNWSIWQDIYIIACTPRALLRTHDAC